MSKRHPAQDYNEARSKIFKFYHKEIKRGEHEDSALKVCLNWLKKLRIDHNLTPHGYSGLRTELYYYHSKKNELKLTVAADFGDSCDFTGLGTDGQIIRIDVTSDVKYKEEKMDDFIALSKNHDYLIAELKSIEAEPIYYPLPGFNCKESSCEGLIYHAAVLDEPDSRSLPGFSTSQTVLELCTDDPSHVKILGTPSMNIPSTDMIIDYFTDDPMDPDSPYNIHDVNKELKEHINDIARFFNSEYNIFIGIIAEGGEYPFGYKEFSYGEKIVWMSKWLKKITGDLLGDLLYSDYHYYL